VSPSESELIPHSSPSELNPLPFRSQNISLAAPTETLNFPPATALVLLLLPLAFFLFEFF
jgi:hypothetical protein